MANVKRSQSATIFILKGLIPYTRENILLSFKPHKFFNELEKISGYSKKTFYNASLEAEKRGLIAREGELIKITKKGLETVEPFVAKKLKKHVQLMVIFDIPEEDASKRKRFRSILVEWDFEQIQKSVWASKIDRREALVDVVKELGLEKCVQIFECARHYPK